MTLWTGTLAFITISLLMMVLSIIYADIELIRFVQEESRGIEALAALSFAVSAFLAGLLALIMRSRLWGYCAIAMAAAGAREMDLHKQWTSDSIFKINFYQDPDGALLEKLVGAFIILLLLIVLTGLIRHIPQWWRGLQHYTLQAWLVLFGLGALGVGKVLDSMARIFPFAADFHKQHRTYLGFTEESLELLGASMFLILCVVAFYTIGREKITSRQVRCCS
jgi:hypothetical protein